MSEPKRNAKGQFPKGTSGNPKGKSPKLFIPDPRMPSSRRRAIMDVADRKFEIKIDGETQKVSLFEANVWQLALSGARGNRIAAQTFINMTMGVSETHVQTSLIGAHLAARNEAIENELARMQAKHPPQREGGVVALDPEQWAKFQEERRQWHDRHLDDEQNVAANLRALSSDEDDDDTSFEPA